MLSLALHKKTRDDCTVMVVEVLPVGAGGGQAGAEGAAVSDGNHTAQEKQG